MWADPETEWVDESQRTTPIQLAADCGNLKQLKILFHHEASIKPTQHYGAVGWHSRLSYPRKIRMVQNPLLAGNAVVT